MRIATTLAASGMALGLVVAGAAAANAAQTPDGWSPAQWTHQMTVADPDGTGTTGYGYGMRDGGTGDPATCPYADEMAVDRDQDRVQARDGTGAMDRDRRHDRLPTSS